jgi:hypothetical protein
MGIDGLAVEQHLAAIAPVNAGEHLDERGFSGSVLAHERMHLAAARREVNAGQRFHARERFGNATRLEQQAL